MRRKKGIFLVPLPGLVQTIARTDTPLDAAAARFNCSPKKNTAATNRSPSNNCQKMTPPHPAIPPTFCGKFCEQEKNILDHFFGPSPFFPKFRSRTDRLGPICTIYTIDTCTIHVNPKCPPRLPFISLARRHSQGQGSNKIKKRTAITQRRLF